MYRAIVSIGPIDPPGATRVWAAHAHGPTADSEQSATVATLDAAMAAAGEGLQTVLAAQIAEAARWAQRDAAVEVGRR